MSNFSDYLNSNDEVKKESKKTYNKDDLSDIIDKYSKCDNDQLMNEFIRLTLEKKKNGELNKKEIDIIKQSILPFLNDEQKLNLDRLLKIIDNVK